MLYLGTKNGRSFASILIFELGLERPRDIHPYQNRHRTLQAGNSFHPLINLLHDIPLLLI
jgi:hypothetical protein